MADPTRRIKRAKTNPDGLYTWTRADIAAFKKRWPSGTKARRAMAIFLYTGAARQDAAVMGRKNLRDGRIIYRRHKTGTQVNLPVHVELAAELVGFADAACFCATILGAPHTTDGFGMWFKKMCAAAGVEHCNTHGLRKAGATFLAEAGATEYEIMSYLGHRSPHESRTYVRAADRPKLADSAFAKLDRTGGVK